MVFKNTLVAISIFLAFKSQGQISYTFLEGLWKIEGKEQYEEWRLTSNTDMSGWSYKMNGKKKITLETLSIQKNSDQIVYNATVANQNDGKTIPFILNKEVKDKLSFENEKHDFPKKIQYTLINENEIFVNVLGKNSEGFSYKMILQKTKEEK